MPAKTFESLECVAAVARAALVMVDRDCQSIVQSLLQMCSADSAAVFEPYASVQLGGAWSKLHTKSNLGGNL